ncbi:MAG TPA: ankyrin repeat domain-containing protein [Bryobacteraceae bacterium]|jgi:ankyrin repeat protein
MKTPSHSSSPRFLLLTFLLATLALWAQPTPVSLATLIQTGNRKAALEKIRAGADVNEAQPDGTRPVHWAVFRVDYELLDALIAKKAKVDVTNDFGSTPLAEAVKLADARMVKTLLDAGASHESPNEDGETALMLAIKAGNLRLVDLLIKAGANVNVVEHFHNQTPLMYAAAASQNAGEMVKLLLSKDANPKPRALFSDWPNQLSSEPRGQYRPVGGLTAMMYAARDGCSDCVDALLKAGVDINLPTPEGVTPLMLALDNEHNDVAKLLLDRGANPGVWDWWGRTALYIAVERKEATAPGGGRGARAAAPAPARGAGPRVSSMEIINALLAANVPVNPELNMHRPSRGGNSGRFSETQLSTGCTPLYRAVQSNDMEVIQALLAKGANPNIDTMGFTSFLVAAGVGGGGRGGANLTVMDALLQHGADVNAQVTGTRTYSMRISYHPPADREGASALHEAAQSGRLDMVKFLLDKGANPGLLDANGKKPVDLVGAGNAAGGAGGARGAGAPAAGGRGAGAGGAGGRGGGANPADLVEIRTLLQSAAVKK